MDEVALLLMVDVLTEVVFVTFDVVLRAVDCDENEFTAADVADEEAPLALSLNVLPGLSNLKVEDADVG